MLPFFHTWQTGLWFLCGYSREWEKGWNFFSTVCKETHFRLYATTAILQYAKIKRPEVRKQNRQYTKIATFDNTIKTSELEKQERSWEVGWSGNWREGDIKRGLMPPPPSPPPARRGSKKRRRFSNVKYETLQPPCTHVTGSLPLLFSPLLPRFLLY